MRRRTAITHLLRRTALAAAVCLAAANGGSAVGQVRFHSGSEEETTALLASELDKARVAHLAALDAHRAYLVEALQRERSLLVQRGLAERDAFLTLVLSAKARNANPSTLISDQIDDEWHELIGNQPKPDYATFADASRQVDSFEIERVGLQRQRKTLIAMFEAKGGKGTYCKPNGGGLVQIASLGDSREAAGIDAVCRELAINEGQFQSAYRRAGPASALIGDPNAPAAGLLGTALTETKEIASLLEAQNALVKTVGGQVKDLNAYYQCQLGRVANAQ